MYVFGSSPIPPELDISYGIIEEKLKKTSIKSKWDKTFKHLPTLDRKTTNKLGRNVLKL